MRIALLVPGLSIGGAEKAFVYLANELTVAGHAVDLMVLDASGPLRQELDERIELVEFGPGGMFRSLLRLVAQLRRRRPEVLISTLTYANVAAVWAARIAGGRTRVFVREATTLSQDRVPTLSKERLVQILARPAYRLAGGVIAVSNGVARDLERNYGVPPERIRVIDNPAIPRDIERKAAEPAGHAWFDEPGVPTILGVGRLTHAKDFPTLIEAFAVVRREREARLAILGDGELRPDLERLVRRHGLEGQVAVPGFVENPFAFMSRASLFVLSSRREGMPNVLIQAMASGCPVVATDCESGPRELLDGGRHGPLVPVGDASALAAAIVQRLDAPRDADALRTAVARFSVANVCAKYVDCVLDEQPRLDRGASVNRVSSGNHPR